MKKIRIVLATLVVAALGLGVSAFTVNGYDSNAFTRVCYKLKGHTFLDPTVIVVSQLNDEFNNTTQLGIFQEDDKWVSVIESEVSTTCLSTSKVCAICFDDTDITLQQVLDRIAAKIEDNSFNYANGNVQIPHPLGGNITVDVYERSSNP